MDQGLNILLLEEAGGMHKAVEALARMPFKLESQIKVGDRLISNNDREFLLVAKKGGEYFVGPHTLETTLFFSYNCKTYEGSKSSVKAEGTIEGKVDREDIKVNLVSKRSDLKPGLEYVRMPFLEYEERWKKRYPE